MCYDSTKYMHLEGYCSPVVSFHNAATDLVIKLYANNNNSIFRLAPTVTCQTRKRCAKNGSVSDNGKVDCKNHPQVCRY